LTHARDCPWEAPLGRQSIIPLVRLLAAHAMRATCAVILGLLACLPGTNGLRDVPKGYCHDCEVTCFEDCVFKFDREVVTPDVTGSDRLSREDTRVEAQMKKTMYGVVLNQNGTKAASKATGNAKLTKLASSYSSCLKQDKCPCSHDAKGKGKGSSFLAAAGSAKKCKVSKRPCALGCVNKTLDQTPALAQTAARVEPGPKDDADDAAIPWSIRVHPVQINTFATGRQDLEQCYKSCLAATCGCDDAPGMEAIDDQYVAIKVNDMSKDPVIDTLPMWQYKHADIVDCGKGMQGKKVVEGLYVDLAGGPEGWVEVCSDDFFTGQGTPADIGKKNCANPKALLAGCMWDNIRGSCVYGLKKLFKCYARYMDDNKL